MADPLRHRQTKGAATDMVDLTPPRHIPTLPADREITLVKNIDPGLEVERGTASDLDSAAIHPGSDSFGRLLVQLVIISRAFRMAGHGKTSVRIVGGRCMCRQVSRSGHDGARRERVGAGKKNVSGAEGRPPASSVES